MNEKLPMKTVVKRQVRVVKKERVQDVIRRGWLEIGGGGNLGREPEGYT